MASRCFVMVFAPRQLGQDGRFNAPRLALAERHPANMGKTDSEFPRDGGVDAAQFERPQKKGAFRVSLGRLVAGQFLAGHNYIVLTESLMTVKEKVSKRPSPAKPEWALKIEAARHRLGWSQSQLAQRCGTSAMAVSRWERGENEPPGPAYAVLGKLVGDPDCWYFWERAGVSRSDVLQVLPRIEERLRQFTAPKIEIALAPSGASHKLSDYVAVPLLKDAASAGPGRVVDPTEIDDYIVVRPNSFRDPKYTVAIRVIGSSMEPSLRDGFIVVVDVRERPPEELVNRMVLARRPGEELLVKYLRHTQGEFVLVAEHTSVSYNPILLSREPGWKIVGEIIWWIGKPK